MIFLFLVSIGTGLLLEHVQHWLVFRNVPELFILVPALLGLNSNLEMTLASRLSTRVNLGTLKTWPEVKEALISNMALVQIQAIVVAGLAASLPVLNGLCTQPK